MTSNQELSHHSLNWAHMKPCGDKKGASFRKIAKMFRQQPACIPSDFISLSEAYDYSKKSLAILKKSNIGNFGIRVHGAGEYPNKLRDADHPVELLYYMGWWNLVESPSIAVVGTRNPTKEGIVRTERLVKHLVNQKITIVSGLAKGIDTVAHKTAIEHGGWTIAVIGTPITQSYPKENRELQKLITERYLLISQVPIYKTSRQGPRTNHIFFPERNITMSALTMGTIIVEASETSGTLIQARAALKQGRKLFILDSCFQDKRLTWPERFEKMGAIRVREINDIKIEP